MAVIDSPLYPRKRTRAVQLGMSALGPQADMKVVGAHIPKCNWFTDANLSGYRKLV